MKTDWHGHGAGAMMTGQPVGRSGEMGIFRRRAEENPAQPPGYAVPPDDSSQWANEQREAEQVKRQDTLQRQDTFHAPEHGRGGINPAQPPGWAVEEGEPGVEQRASRVVVGRVFRPRGAPVVGSRVVLIDTGLEMRDDQFFKVGARKAFTGFIAESRPGSDPEHPDEFLTQWRDGRETWERKEQYEVKDPAEVAGGESLNPV